MQKTDMEVYYRNANATTCIDLAQVVHVTLT